MLQSCNFSASPLVGTSFNRRPQPFRTLQTAKPRRQRKAVVSTRQALKPVFSWLSRSDESQAVSAHSGPSQPKISCWLPYRDAYLITHVLLCRDKSKSATEQSPRHPPLPLQEAAESLSGKQASDDGRVERGSSKPLKDGTGGRFYFNVTGFPFPLGPLFARQTVRTEVIIGKSHPCIRYTCI